MARFVDIHPVDPQPRLIAQVGQVLREGGVIAYPTDSGYALGALMDNPDAKERMRAIRRLDDRHHYTLVVKDFAQLGQLVQVNNAVFRAVKASTPGPYTFILPATSEVPRRLLHPKKRTVGVRMPDSAVVRALVEEVGEPLLSTTLILPEDAEPMTQGWVVKEELDHQVDLVIEAGEVPGDPTTVIDWTGDEPVIARLGAGDPARFQPS
ncbi:MAG: L-threonylcarbamoyladenylate synthase [Nostocoides sp.]